MLNGADPRLWLVLGGVMGLGLLNKVSMFWFGVGLGAGLLLTPERRWLRTPWPWLAGTIAAALFAPFLWWQWHHGWPFLEFSRDAAELKVGEVSPIDFVLQQMLGMHPLTAPLWLGGLVYGFAAGSSGAIALLVWIFLAVFALLAFSGSARPHYLAPAFPIAFALGAIGIERLGPRGAGSFPPPRRHWPSPARSLHRSPSRCCRPLRPSATCAPSASTRRKSASAAASCRCTSASTSTPRRLSPLSSAPTRASRPRSGTD